MKVDRVGDSFSKLEKSQMGTINKLQDKIKLMEFDKAQDHSTIRELKSILLNKKHSINEVIKEIEKIQKNREYSRLGYIKRVLGIIARQGIEDE